jgi:hypothetical protein
VTQHRLHARHQDIGKHCASNRIRLTEELGKVGVSGSATGCGMKHSALLEGIMIETYIIGGTDARRYIISDRNKTYVKSIGDDGSYAFTTDRSEAALFDRLSAITQPIVEAWRTPSFYFDEV